MNLELFEKKNIEVRLNEPLKEYTSFKIGGPADYLVIPETVDELIYSIEILRENGIPYMVLGRCTNILVKDGGIEGAVILLREKFSHMEAHGELVTACAGASLREFSEFALENSLGGMEFANGIPGSVGGGVFMNAGAYDGELKDIVEKVTVLDKNLNVRILSGEEMNFSYRHSLAQDEELIILSATFKLQRKNPEEVRKKMDELLERRKSKQPLEYPSAGSTFKRPEGYFAGKLIDDSGLRGLTHGGAQVSWKHCGFVINRGDATAVDVLQLIDIVKKVVYDKLGVEIYPEVRIIGRD